MTRKQSRLLLIALCVLIVPTVVSAQGIRVTSAFGPVEIVPASGPVLTRVDTSGAPAWPLLQIGDEVRVGPSGQMTLELADGSYMVVSENTTFVVEPYWGSSERNLLRVLLGRIRFHVQRLGGSPNPYRIHTPTALIAVRGTDFDVRVDARTATTEVWTYDGRVTVESPGRDDREAVLDEGFKTLVRAGQYPLRPVAHDTAFGASRSLQVVRTDVGDAPTATARAIPSLESLGIDNDRRNRIADPLANPRLNGAAPPIERGKLSYPSPSGSGR